MEQLCDKLKEYENVSKELQRETQKVSMTRVMFDTVPEEFPSTAGRFSPISPIVMEKDFESGIVKIQQCRELKMSDHEKNAVSCLDRCPLGEEDGESTVNSIFELAPKRMLHREGSEMSKYLDNRFILPTSNLCEHLFSKGGNFLTSRRTAILLRNV